MTGLQKNGARVIALSGGVGGAKLALGLTHSLKPDQLMVVVNTGDDFEHLGLTICPDLDTLLYTLAGVANPQQGWGLRGESWAVLDQLRRLGGEDWFQLGDLDIATHLLRGQWLREGLSLSQVTARLGERFGLSCRIVPMSDDPVRTMVRCETGELGFQEYFVRERCAPRVSGFRFAGVETARPQADWMRALADPALEAVLICPSNPFVSVGPMLALPGVREQLARSAAPVVAVSPIVGGQALKGPAAKMMEELGLAATALGVARHYQGVIDALAIDSQDADQAPAIEALGIRALVTGTVMKTLPDRIRLGQELLDFSRQLRAASPRPRGLSGVSGTE